MPEWVPVIITVALGLAGLGVQALLLAYFLGRMKAQQEGAEALIATFRDFTRQAIAQLTERLDAVDEFATKSREHRAQLDARLGGVERNTEGLQGVRESMAALTATFTAHRERNESDMAHVNRSLEGVQRQLGNMMTGGAGKVLELGNG